MTIRTLLINWSKIEVNLVEMIRVPTNQGHQLWVLVDVGLRSAVEC